MQNWDIFRNEGFIRLNLTATFIKISITRVVHEADR